MKKTPKHHKLLLTTLVIAIFTVGYYSFNWQNNKTNKQPAPKTTISQLSSSNTPSAQKQSGSSASTQGTSKDNSGNSPTAITTPPNQWTQSQSGLITVQQPVSGSTISSNFLLNGLASVNQINYRLIDDQAGVISQGIINIVGGKFSANVEFKSFGKTGRLDVFSTDSNGKEINEVQIPINY